MTGRLRIATGAGVGPDCGEALDAALDSLDAGLDGMADIVCGFIGGAYADASADIATRLSRVARSASIGVTAQGVLVDGAELERPDALVVWGLAADELEAAPLRFEPPQDSGGDWPALPEGARGLVLFADPFTFPADAFLAWSAQARADLPVVGGLASGGLRPGANRLILEGEAHHDGAVALALGGAIRLRTLVSQGCRPIGEPLVVTGADRNLITEMAGEPPAERLREIYAAADETDRGLMQVGLHMGIVIDEYAETHERGGFLVRAVLGAQKDTGALAVGDVVRVGQTVQFHVRDADSADADLRRLLDGFVTSGAPAGALLFTCNGRGARLFGEPDHDASLVHGALGSAPLAGFFAAGELGPVGGRSFLHGFTSSLLTIEEGRCNEGETHG